MLEPWEILFHLPPLCRSEKFHQNSSCEVLFFWLQSQETSSISLPLLALCNGSFGTKRYNETHPNENRGIVTVTISTVEDFEGQCNLFVSLLVCVVPLESLSTYYQTCLSLCLYIFMALFIKFPLDLHIEFLMLLLSLYQVKIMNEK